MWRANPFEAINGTSEQDLFVTDDDGEVCGCFVVLNNTPSSLAFWKEVTFLHRQLVLEGRRTGGLSSFVDSEQKILTNLIYGKQYRATNVSVFLLPSSLFPSGNRYFRSTASVETPSIVHNNFIIGKEAKKARFERHGLWFSSRNTTISSGGYTCFDPASPSLELWGRWFQAVERNTSIPMLSIVHPVHNSVVHELDTGLTQILTENIVNRKEDKRFSENGGRVWLSADSPVYTSLHSHVLLETRKLLPLPPPPSNNQMQEPSYLRHVSASMDTMIINVFSSVSTHENGVFAVDRGGKFHLEANQNVNRLLLQRPISEAAILVRTLDINPNIAVKPCIKILAYKRAASLERLWLSLLEADYLGLHDISVEILIDGPRSPAEAPLIEQVVALARSFEWPFGSKEVTVSDANNGLAKQWFLAWSPISEREVAFVFEDDIEVSPLFFRWSMTAIELYYDTQQIDAHASLLKAIRADIEYDRLNRTANTNSTRLDQYVKEFAGIPILYGICLQQQHVDALRYPQRLRVVNTNLPFLYSLIGTWGPLLLPLPWMAFKEWSECHTITLNMTSLYAMVYTDCTIGGGASS